MSTSFFKLPQLESTLAPMNWQLEHRVLTPGTVTAAGRTESHRAHVIVSSEGALEIAGQFPEHYYGALILAPGSFYSFDRDPFHTVASIIVLPPGAGYRIIFRGGAYEAVLLPGEALEKDFGALRESVVSWVQANRIPATGENAVEGHCGEAFHEQPVYKSSITQQRLLENSGRIIEQNLDTIRISDITAALDVSLRTLERAFNLVGVTPSRYIISRRLNMAARALLQSKPGESSVTEQALDSGFTHLGRFSQNYRKLFGESPKETLERSPLSSQ